MLPDNPTSGSSPSVLDVDHQARGPIFGELDDPHAGLGGRVTLR